MKFVASVAALLLSASIACAQQGGDLPKVFTIQSPMLALGCYQKTSVSTATTLATVAGGAVPTGSGGLLSIFAVVQVETAAARWTDDGVNAPTSTFGQPLAVLTPIYFTSAPVGAAPLSGVQLIPQTGSMTIDACFYGVR